MRLLILFWLSLFQTIHGEVSPQAVSSIWNKMGSAWDTWWELWHGMGACNGGRSLIEEIPDDACIRRKCLLSWASSSLVNLDQLRTSPNPSDWKFEGSISECALPLGAQSRPKKKSENIEVTFIMTLGDNDRQASLSVLELYRTSHEVASGEFIFLKKLGSSELSITYRLIENLQRLFNADMTLLVQSAPYQIRENAKDAIRHAKGKYIAYLEDSIIVTPSWISTLMHTLKESPASLPIGMIGPLFVTPDGKVSSAGGMITNTLFNFSTGFGSEPNKLANLQARVVDFLNSKCVLFQKSLFTDSLFDTQVHFRTDYGNDVDLALSLINRGYVSYLQPISVVIQDQDGSQPLVPDALLNSHPSQFQYDVQALTNKYQAQLTNYCPYRALSSCHQPLAPVKVHDILSFYRQSNRVLILDLIPPEPDKDAGSIRLQELFNIFHKLGYFITFQPNSTGRHVKYALRLLYQGIQYLYPTTLRQLSKNIQKYSAHTELYQCPWKIIIACRRSVIDKQINHIKRLCPHVPIIFDTVDVHFIREQRAFYRELEEQNKLKQLQISSGTATSPVITPAIGVTPASLELLSKDMKKEFIVLSENTIREIVLMKVSNITFVVSSTEDETLRALLPALDIRIVSNIYNPPDSFTVGDHDDPSKRSGILFVGSMCHPPNVDALNFINDEILTSERTYPQNFQCHIVISRSKECPQPTTIQRIQNNSLIKIHYDVSNELLTQLHNQVKIVLAPVLFGAGVKGKVNYALLHGVPVISTSIGAEGMYLQSGESFLEANTGKEFYETIIKLYSDNQLWLKLRLGGLEVMKKHFSRQVAREVIEKSLKDLSIAADQSPIKWKCPVEISTVCPSVIQSDQMILSISPNDGLVRNEVPPNDKQEYFRLDMRYSEIRKWRAEIMVLLNITLPY